MSDATGPDETTWLPNLVGGVSIWKLAPDLNEEKFFGGRLLVPETEGSESLPTTVRWNLSGLVPLSEARAAHGADVTAAVDDFRACLDRVAKTFADEDSGYHRYRDALTVPSLEAGTTDNYFFSPTDKRLYVINWGATPRTLAGQKEFLFGYAEFGKVFGAGALAAGAALAAGTAKAAAPDAPAPAATPGDAEAEKKEETEEKKDGSGRPLWFWLLLGAGFLALVLALLALLRSCDDAKPGDDAGPDATTEAGADAMTDGASDATAEAGADAATDGGDASADARADADAAAQDAGDAGKDAGDAGKDAGKDGGKKEKPGKTGFADDASFKGGKVIVKPGGGGGGGGGGGPVKITVSPRPGAATTAGPHRRHDHPQAVAWRIVAGEERVARTEEAGKRFDVMLHPGESFDGVEVEYQDADGDWHAH